VKVLKRGAKTLEKGLGRTRWTKYSGWWLHRGGSNSFSLRGLLLNAGCLILH
jgi:hypothetical protein